MITVFSDGIEESIRNYLLCFSNEKLLKDVCFEVGIRLNK